MKLLNLEFDYLSNIWIADHGEFTYLWYPNTKPMYYLQGNVAAFPPNLQNRAFKTPGKYAQNYPHTVILNAAEFMALCLMWDIKDITSHGLSLEPTLSTVMSSDSARDYIQVLSDLRDAGVLPLG